MLLYTNNFNLDSDCEITEINFSMYKIQLSNDEFVYEDEKVITIFFNYKYGSTEQFEKYVDSMEICDMFYGVFSVLQINKNTNEIQVINDAMGFSQIFYYFNGTGLIISNFMSYFRQFAFNITRNDEYYYDYILSSYSRERLALAYNTPFCEIKRIIAGSVFRYDKNTINQFQWWSIDNICYKNRFNSYRKASKHLDKVLSRITNDIRATNKNILLLLSAGIDSNLLLHTFKRFNLGNRIVALTFMTTNDKLDEAWDAERSAKEAGVKKIIKIDREFNTIGECKKAFGLPNEPSIQLLFNKKIEKLREICHKENCQMIIDGEGGDHLFEIRYEYIKDYAMKNRYFKLMALNLFWNNKEVSFKRVINYLSSKMNFSIKRSNPIPKWLRPNKKLIEVYEKREKQICKLNGDYYKKELNCSIRKSLYTSSDITHWGCEIKYVSPLFDRELIEFVAQTPASILWPNGISKGLIRKYGRKFMPSYIIEKQEKRNTPGEMRRMINNAFDIIAQEFMNYIQNDKTILKNQLLETLNSYSYETTKIGDDFDALNRYLAINRYYTIYCLNRQTAN